MPAGSQSLGDPGGSGERPSARAASQAARSERGCLVSRAIHLEVWWMIQVYMLRSVASIVGTTQADV